MRKKLGIGIALAGLWTGLLTFPALDASGEEFSGAWEASRSAFDGTLSQGSESGGLSTLGIDPDRREDGRLEPEPLRRFRLCFDAVKSPAEGLLEGGFNKLKSHWGRRRPTQRVLAGFQVVTGALLGVLLLPLALVAGMVGAVSGL